MAIWLIEEDKVLSDTILDFIGKGASIMDAIIKTSRKIGKPIEACSGRWYDHLQPQFKDAMDHLRENVKRINDYVGGWNGRENEKFMDLMVKYQIEEFGIKESIAKTAHIFGRSVSSCSSQWYNYILPRNRLTISNMITEGKQKMAVSKTQGLARNWPKDQENIAVSIVLNTLKTGGTMMSAFEKIATRFTKPNGTVRTYWYEFLYEENTTAITEIRGKKTSSGPIGNSVYDDAMRFKLYTLITESISAGNGITNAIDNAAEVVGRPRNEVHNIWYNHLRKNEAIKEQYETTKGSVTVVEKEKTTNSIDFNEIEDKAIVACVVEAIKNGKSVSTAFQAAREFLTRTFSEIEERWRKTLQYKYVNEIQNARNVKPEEDKKVEVTKTPIQQETQQEQVVSEVQPVVGFDITKINEFLQMVNNVVTENNSLKIQLAEVNDKLASYEELEAQNKQLVAAVERAKQFLNFDTIISKAN